MTSSDDAARQLDDAAETMIRTFTDFLNCFEVEEDPITRAMFDECGAPPFVESDHVARGSSYRIITMYADPFHDEGGGNLLTGFFDNFAPMGHGAPEWDLHTLVQYFDTDHSVLILNGQRTDAWPRKEG